MKRKVPLFFRAVRQIIIWLLPVLMLIKKIKEEYDETVALFYKKVRIASGDSFLTTEVVIKIQKAAKLSIVNRWLRLNK